MAKKPNGMDGDLTPEQWRAWAEDLEERQARCDAVIEAACNMVDAGGCDLFTFDELKAAVRSYRRRQKAALAGVDATDAGREFVAWASASTNGN